jgi:hypothetical protein
MSRRNSRHFCRCQQRLFLFRVKTLRNPGKTAREYVEGNRVDHYKPIALTFVLAGIYICIS